jgi:hypothetical protein
MQFQLIIKLHEADNGIEPTDIAESLRTVAQYLDDAIIVPIANGIVDSNGNKVGYWEVVE